MAGAVDSGSVGGMVRRYLSQSFEGLSHAGLGLVAEPGEGRLHQGGDEPGEALEGEVRGVGHLGVGVLGVAARLTKGHGVMGDDRLVLTTKGNVPVRYQ